MTSNARVLMRVISTGIKHLCLSLGLELDERNRSPPSDALLWGQVSPLGQGFILQRLSQKHSNEITSPTCLRGKTRNVLPTVRVRENMTRLLFPMLTRFT